jgi:hypothetical protein
MSMRPKPGASTAARSAAWTCSSYRDRMVLAAVDDATPFAITDLDLTDDRRATELGPRRGGRRDTDS